MEKLILIHGALGSSKEFDELIPLLNNDFDVITYEIPHHGKRKNSTIPFNMEAITEDFIDFLETNGPSIVYGFSLGGYLALCAALQDTKNILGIITQGTKLDWSPETAIKEVQGLDAQLLKEKVRPFYDYLRSLHGDYLEDLLEKTCGFMHSLGDHPILTRGGINSINIPVRLTRGGKDRMVSKEETVNVKEMIPNGHYFEIPSFPHAIGFIKPKNIARLIKVQTSSISYKWATIKEGRMAYQTYGDIESSDEIILFLHEAIGSIAQWKKFPEQLTKELGIPGIAIEFPGYGFSTNDERVRDSNYLHEFALKTLPQFIEQICPEKKLFIVGHSDGGTNALLYAREHSKNVSKIVTMAAHYINEKETREGISPAIKAFQEGKLSGLELFHGAKTEHLFYNWARTWLNEDFKEWNISSNIEGLAPPTLVIQGTEDQYGTNKQVNGICQLIKNGSPAFIEGCGHAPHLEKTNHVIETIKTWSRKLV